MKFAIAPVIDVGVAGTGNYFLSRKAAADPSLRIPAWAPKPGEEPSVYLDARFLGGLGGVAAAVLGENVGGGVGKFLARAGEIGAHATIGSLAATEAIRKVAQEGTASGGVAPGSPRGVYRLGAEEAAAYGYAPQGAYGYR